MATDNHEVISILNSLIETCEDAVEGFRHASENERNPELRSRFGGYSREYARFAGELEKEVRRLGGDPGDRGVFGGLVKPGWIILERKLRGEDEAAIIAECEYGEEATEKSYEEALQKGLPGEVRSLVEHQYRWVKEVHASIRALGPTGA